MPTPDPRRPIFDAVREARRKGFTTADVAILDKALDELGVAKAGEPLPQPADPAWLAEARSLMGTREIVGPKHNSWIVNGWARLGAGWFNDDETPWCGLFVAHCIDKAGLAYPKLFPRALSWKDWGKPCGSLLGAVAVFQRSGGGHVGFLVGENADQLYVLGGNQSNAVNIMPISKSRLTALRWPSERGLGTVKPPRMTGGTISRNEA